MFRQITQFLSTLRNLGSIRDQLDSLPGELERRRVEAQAGGGMVEVEMNGNYDLLRIRIAPELIAKGDREMIEDLVLAAVNQAIEKTRIVFNEVAMTRLQALPPELLPLTGATPQGEGEAAAPAGDVEQAITGLFEEFLERWNEPEASEPTPSTSADETENEEASTPSESESR